MSVDLKFIEKLLFLKVTCPPLLVFGKVSVSSVIIDVVSNSLAILWEVCGTWDR